MCELEEQYKVVKFNYTIPTSNEDDQDKSYSFDEFKANVKEEFRNRYGVEFDEV